MTEIQFYYLLAILSFLLAIATFISLFFLPAPYGRHHKSGWGKQLPNWLGWIIMEAPSSLMFLAMFIIGDAPRTLPVYLFLLMWETHYINRGFIYPFRRAGREKPMPLAIALMGMTFNIANAYANGRWIFHFSGGYPTSVIFQLNFILGFALFITGFLINQRADTVLRNLRQPGETGYKIPYGGLYEKISCPNYFGEIIEWTGWAIATTSLAGWVFAFWTFANLAPRAISYHKWYKETFPEYPKNRKALIPGIW